MQKPSWLVGPHQELYDYLDSPLVNLEDKMLDLVAWWGVSYVAIAPAFADAHPHLPFFLSFFQNHALRYPTLARVARDYLAIQGSAVKCERAFSSSGQTITDRRNSLHPQTVGALQILKSAYANNYLSANEDAHRRVVGMQQDGRSPVPP